MELSSGGSAGSGPITFKGSGGTLKIDATTMPTNVISGFALGDTIDLTGVSFSSAGTAVLTSGNVLQVVENKNTYSLRLAPGQSFGGASFDLSADKAGGTSVTLDGLSEVPRVTAPTALTVPAGGSTHLGITLAAVDSDDVLSVSVSGVPDIESVSAAGATPVVTKHGATFTYTFNALPAADWNNGLILNSIYKGSGHPKNTLTVKVTNTTAGETATAAPVSISVTDPPASASAGSSSGSNNLSDLMSQFGRGIGFSQVTSDTTAGRFSNDFPAIASAVIPNIAALTEQFMGLPAVSRGASGLLPSSLPTEEQRGFLALHQG
ncbi:hypothetical protein ACVW1C_003313 [Bradyrhizobium sp. USDA 4011]